MNKFKKPVYFFLVSVIIIAVTAILFISPITKYLIEKYDEDYVGRKITLDWIYVNPFTGYIYAKNINIFELNSDTVFFSANSLSINVTLYKILSGTYEISKLELNRPLGIVIEDDRKFNFNDLIEKFATKDISIPKKAPIHLNFLNIKIIDGVFQYVEKQIPINYFLKNVNIECKGIWWNVDTISTTYSFLPGIGSGKVNGDFTLNLKNNDYKLNSVIQNFDLKIIEQYLKELTNYGSFSAFLNAKFTAKGNLNNAEIINTSGKFSINDFHFGKDKNNDYASFDKLVVDITELSPNNHKYLFDTLLLSHPYFKYERYDASNNLETMFGKKGENISKVQGDPTRFNLVLEIAKYVKILAKNFFHSYYKINHLEIEKGDIKFNDYSLSEKFSLDLNPLSVLADSIDKNHNRLNVAFTSGIKPYGNANISLSINPRDSVDFDMHYDFEKIPVSIFNPYLVTLTSYPMDRGTIQFTGEWNVRNGLIKSDNHLVIVDPRVTRRIKNKNSKWVPLSLIMSFIRERGNVIDYEIPITGNLKNPNFHLRDIFSDVFTNIFVKPATTPYRMQVKNTETEIEKSLTFKWEMLQNTLRSNQEYFIKKIVDFLEKNPEASIAINPQQFELKEKEYILFFEAKEKYFLHLNNQTSESLDESDNETISKMSIKDSLFIHYLDKLVNDSLLFTVQEKCSKLIDSSTVRAKYRQLNKERETAFLQLFKQSGVANRITFSSPENLIPYNGFSFYKISYKGEFPESLIKANKELNQLNEESPRDKFKSIRNISKNIL